MKHTTTIRIAAWIGALALAAAVTGCGPSADWRKQTLQVQAAGYTVSGTKLQKAAWSGSGVWINRNTMVTNAHVATRALVMQGKDDYGKTFRFEKILALDPKFDIAVMRATASNDDITSHLLPRPADPRSLRGTEVRAVGNTGGMGLSFYTGKVTNVIGRPGHENLVHSADISSGSSGGPLFDADGNLLGINKAISQALRMSFATPAWLVAEVLRRAGNHLGVDLKAAFNPKDMPVSLAVQRRFCLKPGQKLIAPMQVVGTADLVAVVKMAQSVQPLFFGLVRGRHLMAKGALHGDLLAAWALPGSGVYAVVLVNHKKAQKEICGAVGVGRLAWEKRVR